MTSTVNGDTRTFIEALWPLGLDEGEQLTLSWQEPGGPVANASYTDHDELITHIGQRATDANVWLNVASRRAGTPKRGSDADCVRLPALWTDLDIANANAHKGDGTEMFATEGDAYAALGGMLMPPTITVHTGYGLSAWWVLDEPADVDEARPMLAALKATMHRVTGGRHDPACYDVTRMMRLPGTLNVKVPGSPRPARIVDGPHPARRYSLSMLADVLDLPEPEPRRGNAAEPGDDYNLSETTDSVVALLVRHGAIETARDSRAERTVIRLARPGVTDHLGLTVGWHGEGVTHVFTSGWPELPKGSYDPLGVYARLEHGGDFAAAYRALEAQGYGATVPTLDEVPELDGLSVAQAFSAWLDGDMIHAAGAGWHVWDGKRYAWDVEGHAAMRRAMDYVERLVATCKARWKEAVARGDKDEAKATRDRWMQSKAWLGLNHRRWLIDDAATLNGLGANDLDAGRYLLNVRNGVVDLRTGELGDHDKALRMTKLADADYLPGATSPDWTKALSGLPDNLRNYLRVAVGQSALGVHVDERAFVVLGDGANGKSTVLGACGHVLGDYAVAVPAKLLIGSGESTQELMPLRGARFALAAETGEDHYLNAERMKALTGGDTLTDRHLYARTKAEWAPSHTLWVMTNHRPRVRATDTGTWRRLTLVPFSAEHLVNPDRGLRERLRSAAGGAAILTWIVSGAVEWVRVGRLPAASEVEEAGAQWREDESPVRSFLEDAGYVLTGDRNDTTRSGELYKEYRTWAAGEGVGMLSAPNFRTQIIRHLKLCDIEILPLRDEYGSYWRGMRKSYDSHVGQIVPRPTPEMDDLPW